MQGIEIMTSQEIVTNYAFNWLSFWIVFSIIFGTALTLGIVSVVKDGYEWQNILGFGAIGICLGSILGTCIGEAYKKPLEYTTEYKVTIEDSVPLTEFCEHYKIVGQEGKMYIVREKAE